MIGSALLFAVLAGADPAGASAPGIKPAVADKLICERVEVTGSRLASNKVCMTRTQWRDARRRDQEEVEGRQRRWDSR